MNFPLIANIVVCLLYRCLRWSETRHKQWSLAKKCWWVCDGCGFGLCPAYHLWF